MANSLDAARSMVRTARATGKLLQIGYQRRSNPRYLHVVRKVAPRGQAGRTADPRGRAMEPSRHRGRGLAEETGDSRRRAAKVRLCQHARFPQLAGDDEVWGRPAGRFRRHQVDVSNWFLGLTPKTVLAAGGLDYYKSQQWPDNVMAALGL